MKKINRFAILVAALVAIGYSARALADTFGSGANTFTIDFVFVGNQANTFDFTGDPTPAGSVSYVYRIGTYEISRDMINKANNLGNLGITLFDMTPYGGNGVNRPATGISWNEAARFINWLNTSTGSPPAYKFALQPGSVGYNANASNQLWTPSDPGYDFNNPYRNGLAQYFLPSADEWYKAAYNDPTSDVYYDFPTGSDSQPTAVGSGTAAGTAVYNQTTAHGPADITLAGGLSLYGTMGQGGNVYEWEETDYDMVNDSGSRGLRGGDWDDNSTGLRSTTRANVSPATQFNDIGFRVASIPEPTTMVLAALGMVALLLRRRGDRRAAYQYAAGANN
jgi:formylglycine-generating enzyme